MFDFKDKGFTIVELLMYMFLSSILLVVMALFFNSVLKQYAFISERVVLKKAAAILVYRLERDCELSTMDGVEIEQNTAIIQQISALADSGDFVWSDKVACYRYFGTEKQVKRWQTPIDEILTLQGQAGDLQSITPEQITGVSDPTEKFRTWGNVDSFQMEKVGGSLKVSANLILKGERNLTHTYKFTQMIPLLNGKGEL